jgi:hypothetical protein
MIRRHGADSANTNCRDLATIVRQTQLAGFTTDLHDPRRLHITEYKVSNKNLSKPEAKEQIRRLVREGKIPGEGWFATGALNAS